MTPQEFEAAAKSALTKMKVAVEGFFEAHPDLESDAGNALKDVTADAATVADAEVEHVAPKDAVGILEEAVTAIRARTDAQIAQLNENAGRQIDAIKAAQNVTPGGVAA